LPAGPIRKYSCGVSLGAVRRRTALVVASERIQRETDISMIDDLRAQLDTYRNRLAELRRFL
jgi:hypothetical protein